MDVYMIKTEGGSAVQQITTSKSSEMGPHFSYDGSQIFFSKSERRTLTDGSTRTIFNVWSYNLQTSLLTFLNLDLRFY